MSDTQTRIAKLRIELAQLEKERETHIAEVTTALEAYVTNTDAKLELLRKELDTLENPDDNTSNDIRQRTVAHRAPKRVRIN